MADADVKRAENASASEHQQTHPERAPVQRQLWGDGGTAVCAFRFSRDGNQQREREQKQKGERRLQRENNRKVEPHAMWIAAPENKGGPYAADEHPKHATQIDHGGQKRAAEEKRNGTAPQTVEGVGRLMPGKDKVEHIDDHCRAQNTFERHAPASSPPQLGFA